MKPSIILEKSILVWFPILFIYGIIAWFYNVDFHYSGIGLVFGGLGSLTSWICYVSFKCKSNGIIASREAEKES